MMRLTPSPDALAHIHRVCAHLAHRGEHVLHVAYLGGVAFGGGYRYAAIGMLACMAIGWVLHAEGE